MQLGCMTEIGMTRAKNQDRVICRKIQRKGHTVAVACVCDGIGSMEHSEIASEMFTSGIGSWLDGVEEYFPQMLNKRDLLEDLEVTIRELNELVYEYAQNNSIHIGCTMSLLCLFDEEYFIFHVGDSRIYQIKTRLLVLTKDEIVGRQVNGVEKNYLVNYIGKDQQISINRSCGQTKKGDSFLLCTDGLYKCLNYEDVQQYILLTEETDLKKSCQKLIECVLKRGERDNISCAILTI